MLQKVRNSRGISQGQLSKISGISVRTIQHYESGSRDINHAQLLTLCTLAAALKCRVSDILDDENLKKIYEKTK